MEHLSIYADDLVSQWGVYNEHDLCTALRQIGLLLDLLEEMNLSVSLKKSVTLMKLIGTARKELFKRHTTRHEGQLCLIIPRASGKTSYLPVVRQHRYLGTILTYINPEESTLTYRLQSGKNAFFRLIRFLGKSHTLPLKLKIRLWTQCVLCSYMYGLFAVGLTPAGYSRLSRSILQDLRRITQRWSHLTHVSNSDLCRDLKMQPPIDEPQVRWHEHVTRMLLERQGLDADDFVLQFDLHDHWITLHSTIAEWYHNSQTEETTAKPNQWQCPHCDGTFA